MVSLNWKEWKWLKSTSHRQLELRLYPMEIFLDDFIKNTSNLAQKQIAEGAKVLVNRAKDQLVKRNASEAWAYYYEAELLQFNLIDKEQVEAHAEKILAVDTCALGDGPKKCVRGLIGDNSGNGDWKLKNSVSTKEVIEARRIIQDNFNDKYTFLGLALQQLFILAIVAVALSVAIIITFGRTSISANSSQLPSANFFFWLAIGLFGGVGGAVSGLYGIKQAFSTECGTPETVLNKWITIAKPVVGFVAAIIIATFLIGGLVQAANIPFSNYLLFAMAFISGFSERVIIGAVEERVRS